MLFALRKSETEKKVSKRSERLDGYYAGIRINGCIEKYLF
jgi:hypothetical protein